MGSVNRNNDSEGSVIPDHKPSIDNLKKLSLDKLIFILFAFFKFCKNRNFKIRCHNFWDLKKSREMSYDTFNKLLREHFIPRKDFYDDSPNSYHT